MERLEQYEAALYENYLNATDLNIKEGMYWYKEAHMRCEKVAEELNVPLYQFIAIVAALSPQKRWERNIEDAILYVTSKGKAKLFATDVTKEKCKKILKLDKDIIENEKIKDILNGNKIKSFYNNILRPYKNDTVTIDRHAIKSVNMQGTLTDKKYREIQAVHHKVSKKIGIKAHELQAILWLVVR